MANRWRSAARNISSAALSSRSSHSTPFPHSLSSFSAPYHTIQAIPREFTGSRVSVRDRGQGRIPAVVFAQQILGKNPSSQRFPTRKLLLTTEKKQIKSILNSVQLPFFCSTRFPLQVRAGAGSSMLVESGTVLPIKIHTDEETGKILNLVFVWADEGTELKVDVPIVFKGEDVCPGIQKVYFRVEKLGWDTKTITKNVSPIICLNVKYGGYLNKIRTSLKYLCPAEYIPSKIEVDISKLDIGDRLFMRELAVHPSLKLLSKNEEMPICKIVTTRLEIADLS